MNSEVISLFARILGLFSTSTITVTKTNKNSWRHLWNRFVDCVKNPLPSLAGITSIFSLLQTAVVGVEMSMIVRMVNFFENWLFRNPIQKFLDNHQKRIKKRKRVTISSTNALECPPSKFVVQMARSPGVTAVGVKFNKSYTKQPHTSTKKVTTVSNETFTLPGSKSREYYPLSCIDLTANQKPNHIKVSLLSLHAKKDEKPAAASRKFVSHLPVRKNEKQTHLISPLQKYAPNNEQSSSSTSTWHQQQQQQAMTSSTGLTPMPKYYTWSTCGDKCPRSAKHRRFQVGKDRPQNGRDTASSKSETCVTTNPSKSRESSKTS